VRDADLIAALTIIALGWVAISTLLARSLRGDIVTTATLDRPLGAARDVWRSSYDNHSGSKQTQSPDRDALNSSPTAALRDRVQMDRAMSNTPSAWAKNARTGESRSLPG
jgi:hypothetical protein